MKKSVNVSLLFAVCLLGLLFLSGCTNENSNPIPDAGTSVTNIADSPVFKQTALDLGEHCEQIGGCTCFLDGIRTTCAVVFACLDAGFCELVRE